MSRAVYLHIGAPKTGTTYLQDRLARNAAELARHGVHFPSGSRFVDADLFQFRAALDLLGQDWAGPPGHAEGAWGRLMRRVRRLEGTVVISHEILATAPPEKVAAVMADLIGSDVHVVYSARDLGRQLPAAWQESIKQGRTWGFNRFLNRVERGKPWFSRAFDLPGVLTKWGSELPPGRIHVVTVPPVGAGHPDTLWLRFCQVFGIDSAWASVDSQRTNRSLGVAETELLRRLNRRLDRQARREAEYDAVVRDRLAQEELVRRGSAPVRLAAERYPWAEQQAERWIAWLASSGVDVVGEPDDLRPVRPPEGTPWQNPSRLPAKPVLEASLDALDAMIRLAAERSDPHVRLREVLRHRAARLWAR